MKMADEDPDRPPWLEADWHTYYAPSRDPRNYPPSEAAFNRQKRKWRKENPPLRGERPHHLPENWETYYTNPPRRDYPSPEAFERIVRLYHQKRQRQRLRPLQQLPEQPEPQPSEQPQQLQPEQQLTAQQVFQAMMQQQQQTVQQAFDAMRVQNQQNLQALGNQQQQSLRQADNANRRLSEIACAKQNRNEEGELSPEEIRAQADELLRQVDSEVLRQLDQHADGFLAALPPPLDARLADTHGFLNDLAQFDEAQEPVMQQPAGSTLPASRRSLAELLFSPFSTCKN